MPQISSYFSRTTPMMMGNSLLSRLSNTQRELFEAQEQITTGRKINSASDEPDKVAAMLYLQKSIDEHEMHLENITHAFNVLNTADHALGDANDVLLEAKSLASMQIDSDIGTRETEAYVVTGMIESLLEIVNRQYNDISVFGGRDGASPDGVIFEQFLGGYRYKGSDENMQLDVGAMDYEDFTSNGLDAFGALSSRIVSEVDLDPQAASSVRLADIDGALGEGVRGGSVVVTVNVANEMTVDLSDADTLGDVVTRINDAITTMVPGSGSVAISGGGFSLTGIGGNVITISESGAGKTAGDLGLLLSSTGGVPDVGPEVGVRLTERTLLADFGAAIDFAGGLTITQGLTTKTADFSAATTVQDLINEIEQLDLGLRLVINEAGDALDLVSEVSGVSLSVGENGGTTAEDLGIRSFGLATELADFRNEIGVETISGSNDISISLHDGRSFEVDLSNAVTVGDVITEINAAAAAAGVVIGVDLDVGLATTGNGFLFQDNTAGANDFVIDNVGLSHAAGHLGIEQNVGALNTIQGTDKATVRVENIFTHLADLHTALIGNDVAGITIAGSNIEDDLNNVVEARAIIGVQANRMDDQRIRSEDMDSAQKTMLTVMRDADLTEVVTRYSQLELQLQASLQVGSLNMSMSLLDFLR